MDTAPGQHSYAYGVSFRDDFEGHDLDRSVWIPHYLPQWSSRSESAATYEVGGSELRLSIPPEQGLWCPAEHEGPLRVSAIQSGVFSGEVGSTVGQQPFRDGLRVREAQSAQWGWTPHYGVLEVRARMELTARSMASVWMVGIEDEPRRSGEICLFEVFGDTIDRTGPAVGVGIHPFRDPALRDDFATPRLPIDVTDFHVYATDWRPDRVDSASSTSPRGRRRPCTPACRCSSSTTCARPEPVAARPRRWGRRPSADLLN
jgi:hypothetical protein